jgi:hypothetical protein
MRHHGNSGIQEHSIGDYYPGGTYIKAGKEPGGTIVAWNLVTSEVYGEVHFDDWEESYRVAHALADALIPPDVPYRKQRQHVAEAAPSKDVSIVRRDTVSKYTIASNERILSDEFFAKVNSRRVVLELISYYEGIVERNQQEWVEFQQSEHGDCEDCIARAKALIELNQSVLSGLVAVVEQADAQSQVVQGASVDPLQALLNQLGIQGDVVAIGSVLD